MTPEVYDAVIVGAGFGGIGAAIQLKRMGYHNFVILDRDVMTVAPESILGTKVLSTWVAGKAVYRSGISSR